jgi:hypothetical protein
MELFQLLVAGDLARRETKRPFEDVERKPERTKPARPKAVRVRTSSAAALRTLADRLEPSPTH